MRLAHPVDINVCREGGINSAEVRRVRVAYVGTCDSHCVEEGGVACVQDSRFELAKDAEMAHDEPFAIIWQITKDGTVRISLRSDKNGMNVGELSGQLGNKGGGHANAAGTTFDSFTAMTEQIEIL